MEEDILKELEETNESKTSKEIVEIDENDEISNTQYDLEKVEEPLGKKKKEKVNTSKKYLKTLLKLRGVFFCRKALKIFFILHIIDGRKTAVMGGLL